MPTLREYYRDFLTCSVDEVGSEYLVGLCDRFETGGSFTCPRPNRYAKWNISSALQKSIRRGRVDFARRYCDALLQVDPAYMLRRLNTVAAEDIGVANPLALAAYARGGNSKTIRYKFGGTTAVVRALVGGLASSAKCRLADELGTLDLRELGEVGEAHNQAMAERTDQELLDTLLDRGEVLTTRALALMYFARFEPTARNALVVRAAPHIRPREQLLKVCEVLESPPLIRELAYAYAGRMLEKQAYFLPLTWDLMKDSPMELQDDDGLPDRELVFGGMIAPAIDGHTSQGKKCIRQLIATDPLAKSLVPLTLGGDETFRAFHLTIFRTEGHLCASRLTSAESKRVRDLSSLAVVSNYCRDPESGERLLQNGPALLERLNVIRERSLA